MLAAGNSHSEMRVRTGRCRAHGVVEATKRVPRIRFPFLIFAAMRLWANRRPYRCPVCGEVVQQG